MYLLTTEKRVGYIGKLARSDQSFLFIFRVENETEIRRFQQKVVVEGLERLFEIIEMVVKHERGTRIQE